MLKPAKNLILFSGNANNVLAGKIAKKLGKNLGKAEVERFSDGESDVRINVNVRGKDVFIIQSTCSPANENLMELSIMIDALRRASASRITAVIPYFGYARQDRRVRSERVPISAKLVAEILQIAGANRIMTLDLHSDQIQGFFNIPVDNIYVTKAFLNHINRSRYPNQIVVSPDVGGVVRARKFADMFNGDIAIVDKRRPQAGKSEVMNILGNVKNKTCIIVDDIIESGGTIINAVNALIKNGANEVYVFISHGVLSGDAAKKIKNSKIKKLIVTDTIDNSKKINNNTKIEVLSISSLMSEAIKRIANSNSVSDLFN